MASEREEQNVTWASRIKSAGVDIDGLLSGMPNDAWYEMVESNRTIKDIVGHLTAWSELLVDEVQALAQDRAETIEAVDIDEWNATEIRARRDWPVKRVWEAWQASVKRACTVAESLPPETLSRQQGAPWTDEDMSIDNIFRLWILHIEQHREALAKWRAKHREESR